MQPLSILSQLSSVWRNCSPLVQVKTSAVEGGGEGLYAQRRLRKGEIAAFYNGVRKGGGERRSMVTFYNMGKGGRERLLPFIKG